MIDTSAVRGKIIDLALQGKLSSRRDTDSNVKQLLDTIIMKNGEEKSISEGGLPFEIPESWCWIKLGWVMKINRGGSPRPFKAFITNESNGINWIKIGDVAKDGKYITETKEKIKQEGEKKSRRVYPGDFLLTNSMSFGRPYISKIEGCIHDGWLVLRNSENVFDLDFLYYLLSSNYAYSQFSQKATGSTVDNLNKEKVADAIIPLLPIEEQKRIVERIESIFEVLDRIDVLQDQYSSNQEALKSKLIEAAIQGKLTEQLPEDGTAEELIQSIQKEKQTLVKAGKIKREKTLPEISKDEIPFDIPTNWKWVRVNDIGSWSSGATPSRSNPSYYTNGTIPWIKTGELNDGVIVDAEEYITDTAFKESSVRLNPIGSVLIAMYGATIGKVAILDIEATTNQACCACIPIEIDNKYLFYFLKNNKRNFLAASHGGAQPNISKDIITKSLMPLPPVKEQKRIVERLDALLNALK